MKATIMIKDTDQRSYRPAEEVEEAIAALLWSDLELETWDPDQRDELGHDEPWDVRFRDGCEQYPAGEEVETENGSYTIMEEEVNIDFMFRSLDQDEEAKFRAWARANYKPGSEINPVWHPVIREECKRINNGS